VQARATRAHHKLSNAIYRIHRSIGILRGEALIEMSVTAQNDIGPGLVEQRPEILPGCTTTA